MKFELSIYGESDEVLKKYETDHVRWVLFLQAVKLQEEIKSKNAVEQFEAISKLIKSVFIGLTDEDLEKADYSDILNTFNQVVAAAGSINKSGNSKNV